MPRNPTLIDTHIPFRQADKIVDQIDDSSRFGDRSMIIHRIWITTDVAHAYCGDGKIVSLTTGEDIRPGDQIEIGSIVSCHEGRHCPTEDGRWMPNLYPVFEVNRVSRDKDFGYSDWREIDNAEGQMRSRVPAGFSVEEVEA